MTDFGAQLWELWAPYHEILAQKIMGPINGYMLIMISIQLLIRLWPTSSSGKVEASHILVKDESKAKELREQLVKADGDPALFAKLAEQHSTCPSGKKGGSLGSFAKGSMVPEFDKYCFDPETKVNQVSQPIKTQFGSHLVMVTKKPE
ncbi:hypothetical protein HDU81_007462 [Chytriomyces hyalinus]|nr:hypothetical protein HDU81_007462 [Chytriomyces hyalinus]